MDKRFIKRMELIAADKDLPAPRTHGPADATIGFIGYGSVYGPILEAMERLEAQGIKAKYMELQTLWPFPGEEVRAFVDSCEKVFVTEYSAGQQLKGLVQREATGPMPKLKALVRYDGRLFNPALIVSKVKES
jgi:pyruvate ferredoxin oxidoreductase alpha subunit